MNTSMLHVFRNSPLGRENLMQSAYFCKKQFGLTLSIYIPDTTDFAMAFGEVVTPITLDGSYVAFSSTAKEHAKQIVSEFECKHEFYVPTERAAGNLPLLPGDWAIMTCPRVVSEQSARIGIGHIGPKVRSLVKQARFPVLIPSMAYKAWTSVTAFLGGSELGARGVKEALAIARLAGVPLAVHTQLDSTTRQECEESLTDAGILADVANSEVDWRI